MRFAFLLGLAALIHSGAPEEFQVVPYTQPRVLLDSYLLPTLTATASRSATKTATATRSSFPTLYATQSSRPSITTLQTP